MSKCPSKIFGSCAPNATYSPNGDIDDCLQYCTPSPCPSNLNNILSDCTQYFTNENINSHFSSMPPKCLDLMEDGLPSLSPFCPTGIIESMPGGLINIAAPEGDTPIVQRPASSFARCRPGPSSDALTNVCKVSYTGTPSPIFQKNVDSACKNNQSYPVTSTLYPSCSPPYINKLYTKCIDAAADWRPSDGALPPVCVKLLHGDDDNDWITLPPVSSQPTTYCHAAMPVAQPLVNEATGEYIANEIFCTTEKPSTNSPQDGTNPPGTYCLAQYNNPPSKAFCNKFESTPAPSPTPTPTPSPSPKKGLSTGAIVGIIIGSVALLLIIGVVLKRSR